MAFEQKLSQASVVCTRSDLRSLHGWSARRLCPRDLSSMDNYNLAHHIRVDFNTPVGAPVSYEFRLGMDMGLGLAVEFVCQSLFLGSGSYLLSTSLPACVYVFILLLFVASSDIFMYFLSPSFFLSNARSHA